MNYYRRSIPSVLVLMLALATTGCGKSPEEHLQQGKTLLEKGDRQGAILELKTTLQGQPDNGEARLLLGKIYLATEAYAQAEKELRRAREYGVGDEQVLPLLAKALLRMGEPQKTLDLGIPTGGLGRQSLAAVHAARAEAFQNLGKQAEADQALASGDSVDANHPDLLLLKARIALSKKQTAQAMQWLDAILNQDTKFNEALYLKAVMLQAEGKTDTAIQLFQQVLSNDAKQYHAYLAISDIQLRKGDMPAAEKSLLEAEKIAKGAPLVKHARGIYELQRGDLKAANDALLLALRVMPNYLPTLLAHSMVNLGLGNNEQSLKEAKKVLSMQPEHALATHLLAAAQLKSGDPKATLATLAPMLSGAPNDINLLTLAGEAYYQSRQYGKAVATLGQAATLAPDNSTIKSWQAASHLALGQTGLAVAELEQASKLDSKDINTDIQLLVLRLQQKDFDKALQSIQTLEKKLPGNPLPHNLRAVALMGKKDLASARRALEKALAMDPKYFPAAANLARLDLQDNNLKAARGRFESILAQDANNMQAMLALADLAMLNKEDGEYLKWLEKAAKSNPKALSPYERLVRYHLSKNQTDKAVGAAKQAALAIPENPQALSLLASVQAATGAKTESIASFNTLIQKDKTTPNTYVQLALAQITNKQPQSARANLNRALELKPDFTQAQDVLIILDLTENKPEAALQTARLMQLQNPQSPIGIEREADIHLVKKDWPKAIKAYDRALALDSASTQRFIKLLRAMMLSGDLRGADKRMKTWLNSHPRDVAVRGFTAETHMAAGRDLEAIEQYEAIVKLVPNNAIALNNLASLYQRQNDARALGTAEQALKLEPSHAGILDTVGWILLEKGQLPRATELLRKATEKAPKTKSIRYHYAVALSRSGNKPQAKRELEQLLTAGGKFREMEDAKTLLKTL